jgi:hypothetical protein
MESSGAVLAIILVLFGTVSSGCGRREHPSRPVTTAFASDLAFLREHTRPLVLGESPGPQVVVAPEYQGRVMTSTTGGAEAPSFGWIGRTAIAARSRQPHMNVFGGEDRFWLGPEGGQYSLYFKRNDPFDLDHWQVPEGFDWGGWDVESRSVTSARFHKRLSLRNYADSVFEIEVQRTVRALTSDDVATHLQVTPAATVRSVAFESSNVVRNAGPEPWRAESGLVSVWILGMFTPSPTTTIVIPFTDAGNAAGPIVNDAYFGKVPADRLAIRPPLLFFRGDGQYRSKIGLSPARATSLAGSYDSAAHVLTLVQYTRPSGASRYVNSMWEIQKDPYSGDVINSYNDGPPAPGKPPLGPFYELETSSPALSLGAGERYEHVHRTFHFVGPEADLDAIARATLRVPLSEIASALGR